MLVLETDSAPYSVQQKAGELRADLIVITADIDTVSRFSLFGPFAEQIINHAKVPVLAIRPQYKAVAQMHPAGESLKNITPSISPAIHSIQLTQLIPLLEQEAWFRNEFDTARRKKQENAC